MMRSDNLNTDKLRRYRMIKLWSVIGACLFGFFTVLFGMTYFLTEDPVMMWVGLLCLAAFACCKWWFDNALDAAFGDWST